MSLYRIGTSILRQAGGGGSWRTPSGVSGFTFDSDWSGSGDFTEGGIGQITRSIGGLVIPADPRPTFWAPLESGTSKDATYSRSTTAFSLEANCSIQSTTKPTNASGALSQQFVSGAGTQPGGTNPDANWFSNSPIAVVTAKCYVSLARYRDYDHTNMNGKNFRLWDAGGPGSVTDIYTKDGFQFASFVEGTAVDGTTQHGGSSAFYDPFPQAQNTWYQDEFIFKEGTTGNVDGFIDLCRNGGWGYGASNRQWMTKPSDANLNKTQLYLSQYSATPTSAPPNGSHEFLCHLYVNADSLFRAFVSSESSYGSARSGTDLSITREIQLPVASSGSSTGVQLKFRFGSLSSSGKYLWVVDDTETAFRVGRFN